MLVVSHNFHLLLPFTMAPTKSLVSQLRARNHSLLTVLRVNHPNRPLSSSTTNSIYRGRKRNRNEPHFITSLSSTNAPHNDSTRQFSSTRDNDDIEILQQQLDKLLMEGNGKVFPYQNVWKVSSSTSGDDDDDYQSTISHILSPLDSDKHLDRQSRFLLELLQTLQQVGLTNTSDRVTTERCNAILNQLAATPQSRSSKRNKSRPSNNSIESVVDHWQRIERAKTILDAMETYKDLEQSLRGQIPTDLPCPSHDSYFAVLRLYGAAKQVSQKELDSIVTDKTITNENLVLLQNANEAPLAAKAIVETMEASGKLALLPTSLHWNQVLSCYANAVRRPNRPLEAATLLYDLLQHESLVVDAFSFAHVLRACSDATALEEYYERSKDAVESSEFRKEKESFAKLALAVSKRVWNGLQQQQQ